MTLKRNRDAIECTLVVGSQFARHLRASPEEKSTPVERGFSPVLVLEFRTHRDAVGCSTAISSIRASAPCERSLSPYSRLLLPFAGRARSPSLSLRSLAKAHDGSHLWWAPLLHRGAACSPRSLWAAAALVFTSSGATASCRDYVSPPPAEGN